MYFPSGIISFPFSSLARPILNVTSSVAKVIHSSASAMKRPGHILSVAQRGQNHQIGRKKKKNTEYKEWGENMVGGGTHRLPNPKAAVRGSLTPSLRKRSGLKASGSGYSWGSWRIALNGCIVGGHEDDDDDVWYGKAKDAEYVTKDISVIDKKGVWGAVM